MKSLIIFIFLFNFLFLNSSHSSIYLIKGRECNLKRNNYLAPIKNLSPHTVYRSCNCNVENMLRIQQQKKKKNKNTQKCCHHFFFYLRTSTQISKHYGERFQR